MLKGINNQIAPVDIKGAAPCQEVVLTGDSIDVTKLPVPIYSPKDGGPYITAGIVVSENPETGIPDIGNYRLQIHGPKEMGPSGRAEPSLRQEHRAGDGDGKGSACCGRDRRRSDDHVLLSGPVERCDQRLVRRRRLARLAGRLVKAVTSDLKVPAHAEIVIEFTVDMKTQKVEGPLGEYTGYYTAASPKPVARITAITHRKGAIFQGLLTGKPITENHVLKQIPFEASVLHQLQAQFPTISDISINSSGGVQVYVVIAMKPRTRVKPARRFSPPWPPTSIPSG